VSEIAAGKSGPEAPRPEGGGPAGGGAPAAGGAPGAAGAALAASRPARDSVADGAPGDAPAAGGPDARAGGVPQASEPGAGDGVAGLDLKPALEAVLMVVDEPATAEHLSKVLGRPARAVAAALRELADDYAAGGRGFELRLVAGGWRFYSRADYAAAVEAFVLDGQHARLTQAALETLAVVAYRGPVSRSRVSAVRGVNCDGVMRTLLQRGLVEEAGAEPETGAILYRTTNYFLERMGLRGLDELPELAPFLPDVDAVEAESLEGVPSFDPDAPDPGDQAAGVHADDTTTEL
jgi:segregation and condensation protein B